MLGQNTHKKMETVENEEIMLACWKEEEVLMLCYRYVHSFQIIGLGVIKLRTHRSLFERNNSCMKKSLTHSLRAQSRLEM